MELKRFWKDDDFWCLKTDYRNSNRSEILLQQREIEFIINEYNKAKAKENSYVPAR